MSNCLIYLQNELLTVQNLTILDLGNNLLVTLPNIMLFALPKIGVVWQLSEFEN